MSVLCSSNNLSQLEALNQQFELHCYALDMMMNEAPENWTEVWYALMFERLNFLKQTCWDLHTFEYALRQGSEFA